MMETLKSFQNLPDIEKILLIKKLFSTDENDSEENAPNDAEKSNLSLLLESFKDVYHKDIPEDKVKEEISRGKQKTLDNWLIKGKGVSSPKKQVRESSKQSVTKSCEISNTCNKSDVTSLFEPIVQINHTGITSVDASKKRKTSESRICNKKSDTSKNVSEVKEVSCETSNTCNKSDVTLLLEPIVQINHVDITSVDASRKRKTSESRICNKKSDMSKNVSEVKESIVSPRTTKKSEKTNEKYNLRPKRKASEQPNVSKGSKSGIKHLKFADVQKDSPVITDWDINNQISNFDDPSCMQFSKEYDKCDKSNSIECEKYNRQTKKKNLDLLQSSEINNIADQSESTSPVTHTLSNNYEPLSSMTSPSSPNYEAFCLFLIKCREIGINALDVLQNKSIQTLLNDHKNVNDDAVVFIGSFETKTGQTLPIVHLAESKTVLLKKLHELKK